MPISKSSSIQWTYTIEVEEMIKKYQVIISQEPPDNVSAQLEKI